jgi:hypothetical protein
MDDFEWLSEELRHYQDEEKAAVERVKIAESALARTKIELAMAKEALVGIRGGITEFTWQIKYLKEHGKLP